MHIEIDVSGCESADGAYEKLRTELGAKSAFATIEASIIFRRQARCLHHLD